MHWDKFWHQLSPESALLSIHRNVESLSLPQPQWMASSSALWTGYLEKCLLPLIAQAPFGCLHTVHFPSNVALGAKRRIRIDMGHFLCSRTITEDNYPLDAVYCTAFGCRSCAQGWSQPESP